MLVTCRQMREAEERVFAAGGNAAHLMEEAGRGIAHVVRQFFPQPGTLILYLGTGNNAGDALVAARELQHSGWRLYARLAAEPARMKELPKRHLESLPGLMMLAEEPRVECSGNGPLVLLDGLLGIGSQGALRPGLQALAAEMNALRITAAASTVAMDIPSGLDGDTGIPTTDTVVADVTAVVGHIKAGLVSDTATPHVGRIAWVPLMDLRDGQGDVGACALTPALLRAWLPRRSFEMHKGEAGRVGIIAGSRGFLGAARLACEGALRAGAGFVSLLVKEDAYSLMVTAMPPEVMVKAVKDYREALDMRFDVLAIGPGLGFQAETEVMEVLARATMPVVVDADALTMVGKHGGLQTLCDMAGLRLLTPHPAEMARLTVGHAEWNDLARRPLAETVAAEMKHHTLLLKGARTVIATPGQATLFNTTGHPGMATGGMGDVLTGVCASLIGQGISLHHAAGLGAWLCGRAAELAALEQAQEAVIPSDVISWLGAARQELNGCTVSPR
jgi:NAD(P)H-hydrate epimerase